MKIADNCVVAIHYRLTDEQGNELDSSSGAEPLAYLHGAQGIIPGLESALAGKAAGDEFEVKVAPEHGYGDVDPDMVQRVPRAAFDAVGEVEAGMRFQVRSGQGEVRDITVKEVGVEEVVIDGNHPLAGQVLCFEVSVVSVREATEEEIAHGHVH